MAGRIGKLDRQKAVEMVCRFRLTGGTNSRPPASLTAKTAALQLAYAVHNTIETERAVLKGRS
jgi:hypothetical protein